MKRASEFELALSQHHLQLLLSLLKELLLSVFEIVLSGRVLNLVDSCSVEEGLSLRNHRAVVEQAGVVDEQIDFYLVNYLCFVHDGTLYNLEN